MIICQICKKMFTDFKSISKHITQTELIILSDYYDKYIDNSDHICSYCLVHKRKFNNIRLGYAQTCAQKICIGKCRVKINKKNLLEKYGVDNVSKIDFVKKKRGKTFLERFGGTCPLKNGIVVDKLKKTFDSKDQNFWDKRTKKTRNTTRIRYNVDNINQLEYIKEKKRIKSRKKYGKDYPWQSDEIKKIINQTIKENNTKDPNRVKKIVEKRIHTFIEKYGVDNYSKTLEFRKLAGLNMIRLIMNNYKDGSKFSPTHGKNEKNVYNELQLYCIYVLLEDQQIEHLWPDWLIKELMLIIEYDEKWHLNSCAKKRDKIKDQIYHSKDYMCFRISEKEWFEDQQEVIDKFIYLVNYLEQVKNLNN